jgi:hypothetical protein
VEGEVTTITIWPFADAPQELQDLSTHGGDEDVLCILEGKRDDLPWQLSEVFSVTRVADDEPCRDYIEGWGHIQRVILPDGRLLVICAHA